MSRRYPKNRKKQGGARRALLVFLLTVLILAALVLGTLALLELYEAGSFRWKNGSVMPGKVKQLLLRYATPRPFRGSG